MPSALFVTAALHPRAGAQLLTPDTGLSSGSVVLAAAVDAATVLASQWGQGTWILVGDGGFPTGLSPFLALPAGAPERMVDLAVAAALRAAETFQRVAMLEGEGEHARSRQLELARVGIALSAERNLDRLLTLILSTARELASADAGSLYLVEEPPDGRRLRFVLAQNDSLPEAGYVASSLALDATSLAGYAALTGEAVAVDDVRRLPAGVPYRFNQQFDIAHGYHTRSLLAVPVATRAGDVIGVLQLINRTARRGLRLLNPATTDAVVQPFGGGEIEMMRALAAQAAVAIENSRLVAEIEALFEGFVRASVRAIEQRDPSTSGHSVRVADYCVALAKAVEQAQPATLRGIRFSREELTQLRYAGLLHDFGKVGVREAVLTKGKKLFPERLALVRERFAHARRAVEAATLRQRLVAAAANNRAPSAAELAALEAEVRGANAELDGVFASVLRANEPAVLDSPTVDLLAAAQAMTFPGPDGDPVALFDPDDLRALAVPRGSLSDEEREEIESHVDHSFEFLLTIPWPKRYHRVPDIAYGHHEKLDGSGYPRGSREREIAPEVRMMTVCDIFDALAAGDRPYKRAMPVPRALEVLENEARSGKLDADIVRVFIDSRVFTTATRSHKRR